MRPSAFSARAAVLALMACCCAIGAAAGHFVDTEGVTRAVDGARCVRLSNFTSYDFMPTLTTHRSRSPNRTELNCISNCPATPPMWVTCHRDHGLAKWACQMRPDEDDGLEGSDVVFGAKAAANAAITTFSDAFCSPRAKPVPGREVTVEDIDCEGCFTDVDTWVALGSCVLKYSVPLSPFSGTVAWLTAEVADPAAVAFRPAHVAFLAPWFIDAVVVHAAMQLRAPGPWVHHPAPAPAVANVWTFFLDAPRRDLPRLAAAAPAGSIVNAAPTNNVTRLSSAACPPGFYCPASSVGVRGVIEVANVTTTWVSTANVTDLFNGSPVVAANFAEIVYGATVQVSLGDEGSTTTAESEAAATDSDLVTASRSRRFKAAAQSKTRTRSESESLVVVSTAEPAKEGDRDEKSTKSVAPTPSPPTSVSRSASMSRVPPSPTMTLRPTPMTEPVPETAAPQTQSGPTVVAAMVSQDLSTSATAPVLPSETVLTPSEEAAAAPVAANRRRNATSKD